MINIRREEIGDYKLVESITREAFWDLYSPRCSEHYIVHQLRKCEDFIPELSFVIEFNGKVVGSIFYSKSKVVLRDNRELETITLAPFSILPEYQEKGLGSRLIRHSIDCAKSMGYEAIIILGSPDYYNSYGFMGADKYNITMPDGEFCKYLLAFPLQNSYLDNIEGYIEFSDIFNIDMDEVEKFDKENFVNTI